MKDINLIPDKILYKNQRILKSIVRVSLFTVFAAILACAVLYLPYSRWKLESKVETAKMQINLKALEELNSAEDELVKKLEENKNIDDILKDVPGERIKVVNLISRIADSMPLSVSAGAIDYEAENGEVNINFTAKNHNDISMLLKNLYNDTLYSNVNISIITGKEPEYRFNVTLEINQDKLAANNE